MKLRPINSIEELLKYDVAYGECSPVIVCDRSMWRKFIDLFAAVLA